MAKKQLSPDPARARYELRVWGPHREARKRLEKLAKVSTTERVADCYLLGDDPAWNAKIRDNTLKIKQLVAARQGFEQWASDRYVSAATTPSPFDAVFERLRLDRPQRGKSFDLSEAVKALDPEMGVRAVFVTKKRRRYRIGNMRAESTDITIRATGEKLHTLSIEGDDLDELVALRESLGLSDADNVAVHNALDLELD